MKGPVTTENFTGIIVLEPLAKYRNIKLDAYKTPDFGLPKIQATICSLCT